MRPTIIDIAERSGVSRTTVSNVLNGRPKCSAATRQKVLEVAQELGYHPNLSARAMAGKKTGTIGIILPEYSFKFINAEFYDKLMNGFNSYLLEYYSEYSLLTSFSSDLDFIKGWLYSRNIEALILVDKYKQDLLEFISQIDIPVLFLDNYGESIAHCSYFNLDNLQGGRLATQHLVDCGYHRIAFASPHNKRNCSSFGQRYRAYKQVIQENGYDEIYLALAGTDFKAGQEQVGRAIELGLDAAFFALDSAAVGFLNGLLRFGKKLPHEFGVIGFDNVDSSWKIYPGLSTIDQAIGQRAETAIAHLIQRMEDPQVPPQRRQTAVKLLQRESTSARWQH